MDKRSSVDQFSQKTVSNEILKGLRYITQINKGKQGKMQRREDYSWGQLDSGMFGRNLISVSNQARDIMRDESRMLELYSPVYVLGLHLYIIGIGCNKMINNYLIIQVIQK